MVGSSLFQLTPSRRATRFFHSSAPPKPFQLTPSRRATPKQDAKRCKRRHFNSRPHGGRHICHRFALNGKRFQLTPSRRATNSRSTSQGFRLFQLTPSRRATVLGCPLLADLIFQLTPSRRATRRAVARFGYFKYFNSRPHGGRRCPRTVQVGRFKFQLTPSRRATTRTILPATPRLHFNSRPHGGRPLLTIVFVCSGISTHALTEGDFILKYQDNIRFLFQLTPSRRATANLDKFFF